MDFSTKTLEELVDLLPGRNKRWSNILPSNKWSNDYWCNIDFMWVNCENGKCENGWRINYIGETHADGVPNKVFDEDVIGRPKEAVIKTLNLLVEKGLLEL